MKMQRRTSAAEVGPERRADGAVGRRELLLEDTCRFQLARHSQFLGRSEFTSGLVNRETLDPSGRAPARNLCGLVYAPLHIPIAHRKDNGNVSGQLVQPFQLRNILGDELGSAVVVVEDAEGAVEHGIVRVSESEVESEEYVDDEENEFVEERAEERADRRGACFHWWQMWEDQTFTCERRGGFLSGFEVDRGRCVGGGVGGWIGHGGLKVVGSRERGPVVVRRQTVFGTRR